MLVEIQVQYEKEAQMKKVFGNLHKEENFVLKIEVELVLDRLREKSANSLKLVGRDGWEGQETPPCPSVSGGELEGGGRR